MKIGKLQKCVNVAGSLPHNVFISHIDLRLHLTSLLSMLFGRKETLCMFINSSTADWKASFQFVNDYLNIIRALNSIGQAC